MSSISVQKFIHNKSPSIGKFLQEKPLETLDIIEIGLRENLLSDNCLYRFIKIFKEEFQFSSLLI